MSYCFIRSGEHSSMADQKTMNTNSICNLKILITARRRFATHKATESVNGYTAQCKMSSTLYASEQSFTKTWKAFNWILIIGLSTTIRSNLIAACIASVKLQCKLSRNPLTWPNKNC